MMLMTVLGMAMAALAMMMLRLEMGAAVLVMMRVMVMMVKIVTDSYPRAGDGDASDDYFENDGGDGDDKSFQVQQQRTYLSSAS